MWSRTSIAAIAVALLGAAALAGAAPSVTATPAASSTATATPAASSTATATPKSSKPSTRTYDLDFTLPTLGKSGCLVCHGDPSLARVSLEVTSSIYVDTEQLRASAHTRDTPCTGCHLDFAYTSRHKQVDVGEDWQSAAKSACKNCHSEAFSEYANGAHSPAGRPGVDSAQIITTRKVEGKPERVPLCGDCHGGHSIPASSNVEAQRAQYLSGVEMCGNGRCHINEAATYEDYYHGAAYRRGSLDAPSCWDCHGYHDIVPSGERTSPVHESRLALTCGQEGCHGSGEIDERFLEYAEFIHRQRQIRSENPVNAVLDRMRSLVRSAWRALRAWL